MITRAIIMALTCCLTTLVAMDASDFRPLAKGRLHADQVKVYQFMFRDVTGTPSLNDNLLYIPDIEARFAGGTARCELSIDFTEGTLRLNVSFSDVDIGLFLSEMGGADGITGTGSGWFDFEIPLGTNEPSRGRGAVTVRKANLLVLGPLSSLLMGDLNAPSGSDTAETRVEMENGRLRLRGARVSAPGSTINLIGTIGFDGSLDLIAIPYPEFATLQIIPGIGDVAAWLLSSTSSRLARARIRGDMGNPAVTIAPFAVE